MILIFQLSIIAYALANVDGLSPFWSIGLNLFISTVLIGMRCLAVQLSNPFGTDAVDLRAARKPHAEIPVRASVRTVRR